LTTTKRPSSAVDAPDPPGRRRARKGEGDLLRDEILDAAERLLVEKGNKDSVTIRGVAKAVGVSAPSIYLHFADKEELLYETCRRVFDILNQRLMEAVGAGEGTVVERMIRAGRAYIAFGLEHPGQYVTLFGPGPADSAPLDLDDSDPGVQAFGLLVGLLEAGVESGELKSDTDVIAAAVAVWAAVHGTVYILISKRGIAEPVMTIDEEAVIETALSMMLDGLRA